MAYSKYRCSCGNIELVDENKDPYPTYVTCRKCNKHCEKERYLDHTTGKEVSMDEPFFHNIENHPDNGGF